MAEFWVVGPVAWDRVLRVPRLPASGGFMQASGVSERPGGSGANTAIALASTGVTVHMVGYLGGDEHGARLRAVLEAAAVDVRFLRARRGHTSEVVILVEPSGERAMIGVRPDLLHTVPVPASEVAAGDVVYFAAWHEEFLPTMTALAGRGVTVATVPPPSLVPGPPATYVIGSETQYGKLGPLDGLLAEGGGPRAVVVTRGADGVTVYDRDGALSYPACDVVPVDTTGAGDAFAAGFLRYVAGGGTLAEAVTAGIAWASATVQSAASIPPPWEAVRDSVRELLIKRR